MSTTPNPSEIDPDILSELTAGQIGSHPTNEASLDTLNTLKARLESGEQIPDPQSMHETHVQVVGVSIAELRAAIAANPGHRIAGIYAGAIANIKDDQPVYVEQPDLQALLQGREVEVREAQVNGNAVRTKRLV